MHGSPARCALLSGARESRRRSSLRLNTIIFLSALVLLVVSFWNRNDIPGNIAFVPSIEHEPRQTPTSRAPFSIEWRGVQYRVEPVYEYELTGMIVSYRHHDPETSRMHRRANDHLNMADLCVVWGDTAQSPYLDRLKFWNGIFTCNVQTSDRAAWESFDMTELSNNHLLSADQDIRERVQDVRIGDQIYVRGVLASYGSGGGSKRGTSTTRTDTGDGACETIFIDEFEIVQKAVSYWRLAMYGALALVAVTLFRHFQRPYRPYAE